MESEYDLLGSDMVVMCFGVVLGQFTMGIMFAISLCVGLIFVNVKVCFDVIHW